jgi:hypothetical protein
VTKRLQRGQSVPADVPAPPSGDPTELSTWKLESYVFERLARQLRTVGDGFAWTCFGYDRRLILALSRNDSPGPMYGKDELPYELGAIEELWRDKQHFALHHDLTNCLRIADLTEFTTTGQNLFHEIKAKPHTEKKQLERAQAVVDAIMHGGVLPSSVDDTRLVELEEPYRTNLKQLDDLLQLAKRNGCHGMKLPQGRALIAFSLPLMATRWIDNRDEGTRIMESTRRRALRRAGIDNAMHHIKGYSGDNAARSPVMAPWTIYPFSPNDCAALTCDMLLFDTTVSADALVESLERAGLTGEVLLKPADVSLEGDMPVIRARWRDRTLTWRTRPRHTALRTGRTRHPSSRHPRDTAHRQPAGLPAAHTQGRSRNLVPRQAECAELGRSLRGEAPRRGRRSGEPRNTTPPASPSSHSARRTARTASPPGTQHW